MLATSAEDPDQEYLCQYKVGRDSIFGTITEEDQQGGEEWLFESVSENLDNDNFVETTEQQNDPDIHWHEN